LAPSGRLQKRQVAYIAGGLRLLSDAAASATRRIES
jgi:hypothetical protein